MAWLLWQVNITLMANDYVLKSLVLNIQCIIGVVMPSSWNQLKSKEIGNPRPIVLGVDSDELVNVFLKDIWIDGATSLKSTQNCRNSHSYEHHFLECIFMHIFLYKITFFVVIILHIILYTHMHTYIYECMHVLGAYVCLYSICYIIWVRLSVCMWPS